jgi:PAS domain S-box-containing protein
MSTFLGLSQNIALLLSLTFIFGLVEPRLERFSLRRRQVIKGLLFGSFGLISMLLPIQVQPGIFFDGRTVITAVAGIFGGPFTVIVTGVMIAAYRIGLGGAGATAGIISITSVVIFSIVAWRYFQQRGRQPAARELILIGIVLSVIGAFWAMLLVGVSVLSTTLPITLLLYPVGMLLIGTLIKYQRRHRELELKLRKDQQRFLAIFNSASQFTMLFKPDGTLVEANEAALKFANSSREDVIGKLFWESKRWQSTPEEQHQKMLEAFQHAVQGEFVRFEFEIANAKHQMISIDFSFKPVYSTDGTIDLILVEGRDVSYIKQLEAQKVEFMLERERAHLLKKFISDVSHDLRTPLAVMRLNLDLLKRTTDPQKQQQRIETLAGQEQHLTQLLDDMTTMVSFDDRRAMFHFKPLDPHFVAQIVFDEHHNDAHNKHQKLLYNHGTEKLQIQADQSEIERALNKLYDNALTYTPPDGTITLSVYAHDNYAVFEMRDTGIGISEEDLPEVFNRFFRADDSRNIHNGGAGLGLSIVKKIAEAHGGSVEAESKVGEGSVFRMLLPLLTPENQPKPGERLYG